MVLEWRSGGSGAPVRSGINEGSETVMAVGVMKPKGLRLMLMVEMALIGFDGGDYGPPAIIGWHLSVELGIDVKAKGGAELLS